MVAASCAPMDVPIRSAFVGASSLAIMGVARGPLGTRRVRIASKLVPTRSALTGARRGGQISRQLQSASGLVQLAKVLADLRQVGFDALKLQPPLFAE